MEPDVHQLAALFQNLSTQLRTSLSSLHLAAEHLVPDEAREQDPALDARAAVLDQSCYQLLRLVSSLSSAASLYSGTPLALQDDDLCALVREVCLEAEAPAAMLGLELRVVCREEHHLCAFHRGCLRQLLFHLLSNAFKFTPAGGLVTVELKFSGQQALLFVSDTGCGIDPALLPDLFDRYLHEAEMPPQPSSGLGIGLPLCRSIAEAHGGRLLAESKPGAGTLFTLSLPDRTVGSSTVSDIPSTYSSGFNETLMAFSDALPSRAFLLRNQD